MSLNKIIHEGATFDDQKLHGITAYLSNSLAADELFVDTLQAEVDCASELATIFAPKDADGIYTRDEKLYGVRPYYDVMYVDPNGFLYGDVLEYIRESNLFGKFYINEKPERAQTGKYQWTIFAGSAIGILANEDHFGGIYTGQKFSVILADVIGQNVAYTLDPILSDIPMYGYLPKAKRRMNLQQLLFAVGGSVFKNESGDLRISVLDDARYKYLEPERLYIGGSVGGNAQYTSVTVTEHKYVAVAAVEETPLYEGEVSGKQITTPQGRTVNGDMITFSGPMHSLRADGVTVLEEGANYAVLGGPANGKLYGKAYNHSTRLIAKSIENGKGRSLVSQGENGATAADATLVSAANSENVLDRVFSYYTGTTSVKADLVVKDEKPGDAVIFTDIYGDERLGFIKSMEINAGPTIKAAIEVVTGYKPKNIGNFFNRSEVITKSGNWTVPDGVTKIRVVLISGGQGGMQGYDGEDGDPGSTYGQGKGGAGGDVGTGGEGGRILTVTLDVTPGEVFVIEVGAGGYGGGEDGDLPAEIGGGTPGRYGGETRFGGYSTKDGAVSAVGYTDIFTGNTYASPGENGRYKGQNGSGKDGFGESLQTDEGTFYPGATGRDAVRGGIKAEGGYGGGAASGGNGKAGEDGTISAVSTGETLANAGYGGDGAPGKRGVEQEALGAGGNGGDGGGGGGGGGGAFGADHNWNRDGGRGGVGGWGSRGGNGGVIINLP